MKVTFYSGLRSLWGIEYHPVVVLISNNPQLEVSLDRIQSVPSLFDKRILLTTNELALELRVKPNTIRQWVCRYRHFPKHKIGSGNRYILRDVLAFFNGDRE